MNKKIRVLIVDDHLVVRNGFVTFLKVFDDLELVGQAENGTKAVSQCKILEPDVVLLDMMMPDMNGVEVIQQIRDYSEQIQIIAITSFTEEKALVLEAMNAGALGYLYKDINIDDLASAIRKVHAKQPVLANLAMQAFIQSQQKEQIQLTKREVEVLQLLAEGLRNQEIANRLTLSEATIKFHMSNIFGKLGVTNRTEALALAHKQNILDV